MGLGLRDQVSGLEQQGWLRLLAQKQREAPAGLRAACQQGGFLYEGAYAVGQLQELRGRPEERGSRLCALGSQGLR